jgi:hypothetical protein
LAGFGEHLGRHQTGWASADYGDGHDARRDRLRSGKRAVSFKRFSTMDDRTQASV